MTNLKHQTKNVFSFFLFFFFKKKLFYLFFLSSLVSLLPPSLIQPRTMLIPIPSFWIFRSKESLVKLLHSFKLKLNGELLHTPFNYFVWPELMHLTQIDINKHTTWMFNKGYDPRKQWEMPLTQSRRHKWWSWRCKVVMKRNGGENDEDGRMVKRERGEREGREIKAIFYFFVLSNLKIDFKIIKEKNGKWER